MARQNPFFPGMFETAELKPRYLISNPGLPVPSHDYHGGKVRISDNQYVNLTLRNGLPAVLNPRRMRRNPSVNQDGNLGPVLKGQEIEDFLARLFENNLAEQEAGYNPAPICIWGKHGLGKTTLVESFCAKRGWKFQAIPPAQFEEMGEFLGMPVTKDGRTYHSKPDWVPTEEGPGILLFDDVNRADDRILRGLMQLFQDYKVVSWKLPKYWQIVCTANPEGGIYSVTDMDFAMKTRLLHVTMDWDLDTWLKWAETPRAQGGGEIDYRAIAFMRSDAAAQGGFIDGQMTTPRSLVHLFRQLARIGSTYQDWKDNSAYIRKLAQSAISADSADKLMLWLATTEDSLSVQDFLKKDIKSWNQRIKPTLDRFFLNPNGGRKIDALNLFISSLQGIYSNDSAPDLTPNQIDLLRQFILDDYMSRDQLFAFYENMPSKLLPVITVGWMAYTDRIPFGRSVADMKNYVPPGKALRPPNWEQEYNAWLSQQSKPNPRYVRLNSRHSNRRR